MVDDYREAMKLQPAKDRHMERLQKDAGRCSNFSLYGQTIDTGDLTYFASVMCGNKCCFVCNFARQKRVRRKYFKWFADNPTVYLIGKGKARKHVTKTRYQDHYKARGYEIIREEAYDIMHLTLTVPHYADSGFNGDQYYYEAIAQRFHNMRNEASGWNDLVFGGEYGIETTRTDNGLHIHIHALLFVKQSYRNRNTLHRLILQEWNRRTENRASSRQSLDARAIQQIKKSNRDFSDDFVKSLNPRATTMINLETIYSYREGEKVRTYNFNSKEMLYAVMEAIKYHFEPLAFDKENKEFDFDLLSEIMPVIYKKQLYKKFGCLHGEKALNLKEDDTLQEDFADAKEILSMVDQDTGEIRPEYDFFVMNPAFMYHVPERENKLVLSKEGKRRMKKIPAFTVSSAISQMGQMVKATYNPHHSQTINN